MAEQQIKISFDEKMLGGNYSNFALISHSENEFVIDFIFAHPPAGKVVSRMILSPSHAKSFLKALHENINNYEKKFGPIKEQTQTPKFGINIQKN